MEDDHDSDHQFLSMSSKYGTNSIELRSLRSCLNWLCVYQSNPWKTTLSWSVFFLFGIGVPIISHFVLSCSSSCDEDHKQPFDAIVELSLSSIAALSYVSLMSFARKYGLRKFLFLDKLCDESEKVRVGYTAQLQRSMKILCIFVLPCLAADVAYRIWWYITGGTDIPHWGNIYLSHSIACTMELCSWFYRSSIFFLGCVLYRLICYLQILRLEDFAQVFQLEFDVGWALVEHLRIRKVLRVISHRFRLFILWTLLLVTASQLASLLVTTKNEDDVNIYTAGELALCSVTLVTGLCICLRSATKITHKAQSITSLAAKWHAVATIGSLEYNDTETPMAHVASPRSFSWDAISGSYDDEGDEDDELDNTKMVPSFATTICYQKRQALVTYLENNRAGITVYGFMLDRTYLHTIFGVELSLVLWLLSKTIGIS
ncbi:hypothetical protein Droror1_Dr00016274 [Drosera rotundifolia]